MSKQLSLFHTTDQRIPEREADAGPVVLETDAGSLDELFRLKRGWRSRNAYVELLDFVARFPGYSPLNGFLIFLQNPEATFVATAKAWLKKYNRQVKSGARPLVILAPMSPMLFVFDVQDTRGPALAPAAFRPAAAAERLPPKIYDNCLHNCRLEHIAVREIADGDRIAERALRVTPAVRKKYADLSLAAGLRYAILLESGLTLEKTYAALVAELGHLFCGHLGTDSGAWWPDRKELDVERVDIEAASVAYLTCRRLRLFDAARHFLSQQFRITDREVPPVSLNAVFQAVGYIERMGKVRRRPNRKATR